MMEIDEKVIHDYTVRTECVALEKQLRLRFGSREIDDALEFDSRREQGLCPFPTSEGDCSLTGDICNHGDAIAKECSWWQEYMKARVQ